MGDLQVKTLVNSDGYTVTGNTTVGEDVVHDPNDPDEGVMRPEESSGDIEFVGNSDSLVIGGGNAYNPSINAPVAAENKPGGT